MKSEKKVGNQKKVGNKKRRKSEKVGSQERRFKKNQLTKGSTKNQDQLDHGQVLWSCF